MDMESLFLALVKYMLATSAMSPVIRSRTSGDNQLSSHALLGHLHPPWPGGFQQQGLNPFGGLCWRPRIIVELFLCSHQNWESRSNCDKEAQK